MRSGLDPESRIASELKGAGLLLSQEIKSEEKKL
jgi:hypothetical protein